MASTKEGNYGTEAASNYEMMASRRASPNSGGHSVEQGERGRTGDGNAPERQQCRVTTIPVSRVLGAGWGLSYCNCGNCNTRHHSQMPPPQWKRENCRTQWQTATNSSDTVGRQLNSRESRCFTSTRKNNPKRKKSLTWTVLWKPKMGNKGFHWRANYERMLKHGQRLENQGDLVAKGLDRREESHWGVRHKRDAGPALQGVRLLQCNIYTV